MINVAVVEDDKAYAEILEKYIAAYADETRENLRSKVFADGMEFVEENRHEFDIVFMDVEMPNLDGITAARKLRENDNCAVIIFVTNMAQYALSGYDVDALGYMIKPVSYFNFKQKLDRALAIAKKHKHGDLLIPVDDGFRRIDVNEITYVEVIRHAVFYHTEKEAYKVYASLKNVEKALREFGFARCNRFYLVNLRYVTAVRGNAVTVGGTELQISRSQKNDFVRCLAEYMGSGYVGGGVQK